MSQINEEPKHVAHLGDMHDRLTYLCTRAIVSEPILAGGDSADCMVILTSVVLGVMQAMKAFGRDTEADIEHLAAILRESMPVTKKVTVPGLYGSA